MKEKRILVLGYGMLGQELVEQTGWDYKCIEEHGFDITKPQEWNEYLLKVEFGAVRQSGQRQSRRAGSTQYQ